MGGKWNKLKRKVWFVMKSIMYGGDGKTTGGTHKHLLHFLIPVVAGDGGSVELRS